MASGRYTKYEARADDARSHPPRVLARQRRPLHVLAAPRGEGRRRGPRLRGRARRHRDAQRARRRGGPRRRRGVDRALADDREATTSCSPHGMSVGRGYGPVVVAPAAEDPRLARGGARRRAGPAHDGGIDAAPARSALRAGGRPHHPVRARVRGAARGRGRRGAPHPRGPPHLRARGDGARRRPGRGVGGGDGRAAAAARRATPSGGGSARRSSRRSRAFAARRSPGRSPTAKRR